MGFFDLIGEPAILARLPAGRKLAASSDGRSLVVVDPVLGAGPPFAPYARAYEAANTLLHAGAPLRELRDAVIEAGGPSFAASYLIAMQTLYRFRGMELVVIDETGEQAVMQPQWDGHAPRLADDMPPPEAGLDRFACLRSSGRDWILESPLAGTRFRLPDPNRLEVPVIRRALAAEGFLDTGRAEAGPRSEALMQWEFHDLLYHWHHRPGWHGDPIGGLFPFVGQIDPPPGVRPPWPGRRIALPVAPDDAGGESLVRILERRRSERVYDEARPISLADLGALLDRAARILDRFTVQVGGLTGAVCDFETTRRPYPTGGASYELEIYPVVDRCDGLESGLYHYDAATHELVAIAGRTTEVEAIVEDARVATGHLANPQIVLAFSARFARVMWKYRSIAYGVILRNVGVLYQTLYLVATDLGLSPCGLGTGNSARFARVTGLDPVVEGTVGDFILGGPPKDRGQAN